MQEHIDTVRQWIETIWNAGDLDQIDCFHPPVFDNEGKPSTPTEARAWHAGMRTTFPDIRYQIEDLFAAGDRVTIRWRAQATHQGMLWGFIPPTGKQIEWPGIHIVRVNDGKTNSLFAMAISFAISSVGHYRYRWMRGLIWIRTTVA